MAVVEDGKLTGIEPLAGHPSGEKLCPKGKASSELVYHQDRLTRPLRRTSPKDGTKPSWESISWDEALDDIAHRMAEIRDVHGAEQIAFSFLELLRLLPPVPPAADTYWRCCCR